MTPFQERGRSQRRYPAVLAENASGFRAAVDSAEAVAAVQAKLRAPGYIEDVNGNQIERVLPALLIYPSIIGSTCNCKQQLPLAWRRESSHDNNTT